MSQAFDTAYPKIVVSPLALSVVLDTHQRVGDKLKHCVCSLMGVINDDGSIYIADAFANHVIANAEEVIVPEKTHHEHMVQTRQKFNPRELVIGWATTDLTGSALEALSDWARQEPRSSKFVHQKRMAFPLLLRVSPPTESSDLEVRCFVKGPVSDCILKPLPVEIRQSGTTGMDLSCFMRDGELSSTALANEKIKQSSATQGIYEILLERVNRCIEIAQRGMKGDPAIPPEIGRQLYRAVVPPLGMSLEAARNAEDQEAALMTCMSDLLKLEFELADKLHSAHLPR